MPSGVLASDLPAGFVTKPAARQAGSWLPYLMRKRGATSLHFDRDFNAVQDCFRLVQACDFSTNCENVHDSSLIEDEVIALLEKHFVPCCPVHRHEFCRS